MEDLKYFNSGYLNIEILKNNQRYQVLIPVGVPWEDAEMALDDLKRCLIDMKTSVRKVEEEKILDASGPIDATISE